MASTFETDGYNDAINGRPATAPFHFATAVYALEYDRGYQAGWLYSGRAADAYSKSVLAGQRAAAAYKAGSSLGEPGQSAADEAA